MTVVPDVALRVEGLTCRYGDHVVVDDVSFVVHAGELLSLVGPSGCGKSTLLRAVAGLDRASAGRVWLGERDVTALEAEQRRIGLVFQDHALFGHMRVDANVAFGLRHLPRSERVARVDEVLQLVRLTHTARRYPHELSGGEQQRIALARALAPRPAVVLLDEPFASLDEQLRDDVGAEVAALLAQQGTAAVLVTHDRAEALTLGRRVAVMNAGRLVQIGPPDEVYGHPADAFVEGFLATTRWRA